MPHKKSMFMVALPAWVLALPFLHTTGFAQPSVSTPLRDITVVERQTPVFRVWATSSGGPLAYQWFRNGEPIAGANADRLFPAPAVSADDSARFRVAISDANGTTLSNEAVLRVSEYTAAAELPRPMADGATYHLDAANGDDAAGDGSESAPFRTFARVRPLLTGGDVVVFRAGDYGEINLDRALGTVPRPFLEWVTLRAREGETVRIERVYAHGNWEANRVSWNGNFDLNVRFIGFHIVDGVRLLGVNRVRFEECLITRLPPYNLTAQDLEKTALTVRGGRSITVEDGEITDAAHGISARGNDLVFRRNKIHRLAHDGIRVTGCDVVLIEGNHIFNTDDGYDDGEVSFARHADGIQIYMESDGSSLPIDNNNELTIRGNRIYHHESMAIMASGWGAHSRNWVIENNVFGPTRGYMIHMKLGVQGFVFRHNSVVSVEGATFESRYRTLPARSYAVALPTYAASSGVEIYNNIFRIPPVGQEFFVLPANTERYEHNLFHGPAGVAFAPGEAALLVSEEPFANPADYDGRLRPDSAAIKAGSLHRPIATDIFGNPRTLPPDIGAVEFGASAVPGAVTSRGTPHAWLEAHGLVSASLAHEDADALDHDGDGMAAWMEHIAGTDPNNPASVFRIRSFARVGDQIRFEWEGVRGRVYQIHQQESAHPEGWVPVGPSVEATANGPMEATIEVEGHPMDLRLYRLSVSRGEGE